LEALLMDLKGLCHNAAEEGSVDAIVQAVSVEVPSRIRGFMTKEEVAQAPSRLRALARGLSSSLLIDINTLRRTYFLNSHSGPKSGQKGGKKKGYKDEKKDKKKEDKEEKEEKEEGANPGDNAIAGPSASAGAVLGLQALLTMQLGTMCLLPQASRLRVLPLLLNQQQHHHEKDDHHHEEPQAQASSSSSSLSTAAGEAAAAAAASDEEEEAGG
jgi:hypothetical protein